MKRIFLVVVVVLMSLVSKGQINTDLGISIGTSSSLDDVNKFNMVYQPSFTFGGLYRVNFDESNCFRFNVEYGGLKGDDLSFSNGFQKERAHKFNNKFMHINANYEYNFFNYWVKKKIWSRAMTPFASLGVGLLVVNTHFSMTIPITIGAKFVFLKDYTLSVEASLIKTFLDNNDDLADPYKMSSGMMMNKDYISRVVLTLSYRFSMDKVCMIKANNKYNGYIDVR